ncbi:MAG: hypothetical protein CM15mP102_03090 [Flavobacteriales bacterium]|nr:MAG: hypothetical protein CM15mP102_03090 [Flavobacteriales bacterium]
MGIHKGSINLVSPSNKRNIDIIVVGTGLAGASASATLASLGYNVKAFVFRILQEELTQLLLKEE